MDTKEYMLAALADAHLYLNLAVEGLTDEIAHWHPGGNANSIAQMLGHMAVGQDNMTTRRLSGTSSLFESGWQERLGIPVERSQMWQTDWRLNLEPFKEYVQLVNAQTTSWLTAATDADLDRKMPRLNNKEVDLASMFRTVVIHHIVGHAMEGSTLKGIKGLKGLPF